MQGDHINERLKELIAKTNNTEITSKEITLHCLRQHSITNDYLKKEIKNTPNIESINTYIRLKAYYPN